MPEDWQPAPGEVAYAREHAPSIDIARTVEDFVDYWVSIPGQRGVRLDWSRTWQTWVRRAHDRNVERGWSALRPRAPEIALDQALMRLDLLPRALRRRLLSPARRLTLNRGDPLGAGLDFSHLDALADSSWGGTHAAIISAS